MFVKLWMKTTLLTISPGQSIREAEELMSTNKIRRLPVVKGERLVGIISRDDLFQAMPSVIDPAAGSDQWDSASQAEVATLMSRNPIVAAPMDILEDIAATMKRNKLGGLPVCEGDTLVGIITESDIFQAFSTLLGAERPDDVRIELIIDNDSETLYEVIDLCCDHDLRLNSLTIFRDYSPDHQLITLRVKGEEVEPFIDDIWKSGSQVLRILHNGQEK
ncbi:MAG: CBS and ACT domain-containing protein [Thermodesulfobacteriota bacterium]